MRVSPPRIAWVWYWEVWLGSRLEWRKQSLAMISGERRVQRKQEKQWPDCEAASESPYDLVQVTVGVVV
jgi:hypothetical protein